jgi:hypothetical protein
MTPDATQPGRDGNFSDISVMRAVYTACLSFIVVLAASRCANLNRPVDPEARKFENRSDELNKICYFPVIIALVNTFYFWLKCSEINRNLQEDMR